MALLNPCDAASTLGASILLLNEGINKLLSFRVAGINKMVGESDEREGVEAVVMEL